MLNINTSDWCICFILMFNNSNDYTNSSNSFRFFFVEFNTDETQVHVLHKRSEFCRQAFHGHGFIFKLQAQEPSKGAYQYLLRLPVT